MVLANSALLGTTRTLLRLLIILNIILGLGIAALLVASLIDPVWVLTGLGVGQGAGPAIVRAMRIIMVIGVVGVGLTHFILTRLLPIVDAVRAGDPFVGDNAARLQTIAWLLLAKQILHLAVGAVEATASSAEHPFNIDWSFSTGGWLAVLLLFVLARVFAHGAEMREDLEETV